MKVKICGIKTIEAAEAAAEHGADFIGFIFFDRSRRYVEPNVAAEIGRRVSIKKVGVFVDAPVEEINAIVERVGLDYVQLHGHETVDSARKIERPIIKAWRFGDNFDVRAANEFPCEIILLDSYIKGMAGGTGQLFNWTAAARLTSRLSKPLMIAGGISIENVGTAIDMFRPFGLDVSGSLEIDGVKSVELIEKFMSAVRSTDGGD
ncbi:MAG: phosphoribosylanthranilate isomerase [Selenomonadaceae bacterium]|nr:phosphoribosylanthranilate isomerase [Selenomonadaceae bacterium]